MLMPVEEDEKTEGHNGSKRNKKQGKAFFLMGRTAFTEVKWRSVEVIQEILRRNWKKENEKESKKMEY